jgi:hypothetical protein
MASASQCEVAMQRDVLLAERVDKFSRFRSDEKKAEEYFLPDDR